MDSHAHRSDRRRFLAWLAGANAFFVAHGCGFPDPKPATPTEAGAKGGPRIRRLHLASAAPLEDLKAFYHNSLGLRLLEETPQRLTIHAGQTRLSFRPAAADEGKPFYHFAFNIPENKLLKAYEWQRKRTPLLPIPATLRDPSYPDEVVNYSHWNAHSIFFFDPAGNVVEYIARHDLKDTAGGGDFGPEDILYASEIAFVVDEVPATTTKLKEVAGVENYKGSSDQFAAIGDERGLLLVMKRGRVISFDAPERKAVGVFPTAVAIGGRQPAKYAPAEFPYELSVED
jgi:catechol 2,3-dioxygenase-like lactoylglutathione lyase family enzyme